MKTSERVAMEAQSGADSALSEQTLGNEQCAAPSPDAAAAVHAAAVPLAAGAASGSSDSGIPSNSGLEPQEEDAQEQPPPPPPQVVVDRAPATPTAVETSTTAISLSWAPVVCTVHSSVAVAVEFIVNYELQMQQVDDKAMLLPERWSVQYRGTATFVQVKGLRPGNCYAARIIAVPEVTNMLDVLVVPSPPSDTMLVHTLPCPPMGQPAPQLASRLKKELKFKWSEPEETGGRPLEYVLQISPPPEGCEGDSSSADSHGFFQVYHGPERAFLVKRLVPGVQYCARVKAFNSEGESAWSPLAVCYTQATVPSWSPSDAPFVWDTTATSVSLGWPEPAANGGSITEYEVEMDDSSGGGFRHVTRCSERQCVVEGLRSGILYKFRVRAENEAGRSLWSPLGEGRTAAVAPGACSAPAVLGTSQTSLSIHWEGPEDDGGSPIVGFQVEVRPRCAAACRNLTDEWAVHYQGPEKACTIGGLRAGCSYMARVAAVSKVGPGPFSAATIMQTAPSIPGCPGNPTSASRQQTEVTVAWAAPEHDGGSPISAYRLEMCCLGSMEGLRGDSSSKGKAKVDPPFELAYLGPERSAVLTGLQPGHRYSLRCSAINEQGSSGWGHTTHVETLPGPPFPVDAMQLVAAASTSLKLGWSQPFGQGAPVTSYVLEMAAQPRQPQPPPLPRLPAQEHVQQGAGGALQGQWHDEHAANGELSTVSNSTNLAFHSVYQGGDCACTVSGLQPDTDYVFRVQAINSVGSSWSEPDTFRTAPAPPSCPCAVQQQDATPYGLHISWRPPAADHGAAVTGYQLECARSSSRRVSAAAALAWKQAYQGPELHAQVDGLSAGSRYFVRVRAHNTCGWGPWSEPLPCSTAPDVPHSPPGLHAKAVGTSVRASWEAAEDNGAAIQAYELEMATGGTNQYVVVFHGDALSHRLQQLAPNTSYSFRVRAINDVGAGPVSPSVAVRTSKAPPVPPVDIKAQAADGGSSATSIEVSWVPAHQGPQEASCISFEVEASGPSTSRQTCTGRCTSVVLTGLQPGAAYTVKVRGVGADGAGHGAWSTPGATVSLRALRADELAAQRPSAAAVAAAAGIAEPAAKVQKRKGERSTGAPQQRTTAVVKTAAAKAPPKKGWQLAMSRLSKFLRQYVYRAHGTTVLIACCVVALILFLAAIIAFHS